MKRLVNWFADERALYVLVALFVFLGALYSVTTPIFEAGDELWHYPHVQWIARGNGLPVQDPTQKQLWEQEGGQPPLYYVTSAALTFWIDTRDMEERLWRNPFAQIGVPLAFGNKNMIVHTRAENFPWQATTLAVHLIRLLSVLFSAGTVAGTYKIVQELCKIGKGGNEGNRAAWFAASFVAFNPMFLFISASVNNDSLAAVLATSALYLTIQLVTRGVTNVRLLFLGIIVGLAILTKVSNLALGIVAVTVLAYCAWKKSPPPHLPNFPYFPQFLELTRTALVFGLPILILCSWWFARNYFLYGDPLAFNVWLQIAGGRPPQTVLGLLNEFQGFRISFWGNFGGVNLIAPEWVYTLLDIFSLLALLGLGIGVLRRALPALLWIPALHVVVVFSALIRWTLMTYASQGRLMFPTLAALAILFAFGLYQIAYRVSRIANRLSPIANRVSPFFLLLPFAFFLFAFSVSAPFLIIAPAYAQPARIADETRVPNRVDIQYDAGDAQPELLGYETVRSLRVGQALPLKLFWRTDSPIAENLALYIHVYDARGELIGQWDAFTGNGLHPTSLWQPREIFVDEYRVPLRGDAAPQQIARVEVGLARLNPTRPLIARDPQGNEITPSIAEFGLYADAHMESAPARFVLGEELDVVDARFYLQRGITQGQIAPAHARGLVTPLAPGDEIRVEYALRARRENLRAYTVFAQLVNAQGVVVAQYDSPPRQNAYPTSFWRAGETVRDAFTFTIPQNAAPGMYAILFGVYASQDRARLPVRGETFEYLQANGDHLLLAPVELAR